MFILYRRIPLRTKRLSKLSGLPTLTMYVTPQTTQGGLRKPPTLPQIPIPSEDEYIPEDETIEITRLDMFENLLEGFRCSGKGSYHVRSSPRPILEVIPEYPSAERKRGVEGDVILEILVNYEGRVDSVQVLSNTTTSKRLELSAIEAAYKSRYIKIGRKGNNGPIWIERPYRFEKK